MNQRILQNCKAYFLHPHKAKCSPVLYTRHTDFSLSKESPTFFHQSDCDKIDSLFKKGKSIVILTAKSGMGKSHTLREYAKSNKFSFGTVILTAFDKNRYLFSNDLPYLSDDYIVKKCITQIFYDKEFYSKRYSHNYFLKDSATEILFSLADKNTLIIIDNFDLQYIPDFLYKLCNKGFKILLSSRNSLSVNRSKKRVVSHLELKDTSPKHFKNILDTDNRFINVFGCNLLAAKLAEKYMKFHSDTDITSSIIKELKSTSKHEGIDLKQDFVKAFWHLYDFNENCGELLRTICLMLFFIPHSSYISDESSTFFSLKDACLYTGTKKSDFKTLISSGFINTTSDGLLYMDEAIVDFVFRYMKPTSENCPRLVNYITSKLDFKLSVLHKDIFAQVYTQDGNKQISKPELYPLFDVIAYFSKDDAFKSRILYNYLYIYVMDNLGMGMSHRYSLHLLFKNTSVMAKMFCEAVSDNSFKYMCDKNSHRVYSDVLTQDIQAQLDIISVCISLIRFSHIEQYDEFAYIFKLLSQAFSYIASCEKKNNHSYIDVYYRVIQLCRETFFHFNDLEPDGSYNYARCNERSCIGYTDNEYWNKKYACSLFILHSPDVLRLYGKFNIIIRLFLHEYKNCDTQTRISFSKESCADISEFSKSFSSFVNRLKKGFGVFYKFYDKSFIYTDTQGEIDAMDNEKLSQLIDSARHYRQNFYDGKTKESAKCYAKQIINTISTAKNSLPYILTVTDTSFPISDRCLSHLKKPVFSDTICKSSSKNMLCSIYKHCTKQIAKSTDRLDFYAAIINKILSSSCLTEVAKVQGVENISFALISRVCKQLENYTNTEYSKIPSNMLFPLLDIENVLELYDTATQNTNGFVCCEHCISTAIQRLIRKKKITVKLSALLFDALSSFVFEHLPYDNDLSRTGFSLLLFYLLPKKDAVEIINTMLSLDLSLKISPKEVKQIKTLITWRK